jgi:hypothetical protein
MKPAIRYAVVGAAGGIYYSWHWAISTWVPVTDLFTVVQASAWTSASRDSGDPGAYEDALRTYLNVLDMAIERDSTSANRRMYKRDKQLTLIRLSNVVRKRGAGDDAASLRAQASALCSVRGSTDCSPETLAKLVEKLDSSNVLAGKQ